MGILDLPHFFPPVSKAAHSKLGRVIGSPDIEGSRISTKIIHTIEDGGAAR